MRIAFNINIIQKEIFPFLKISPLKKAILLKDNVL